MDARNVTAGLASIVVGTTFAAVATGYGVGSLARMGAGFFPLSLGIILTALGLVILLPALRGEGAMPRGEFRPAFFIGVSILIFAMSIRVLGLVPTLLVTTLVACLADETMPLRTMLLISVCVTAGCFLVFVYALGLTIPAFGTMF